jgi:hypothetical protein
MDVKDLVAEYQEKYDQYTKEATATGLQLTKDINNEELKDKWFEASAWEYAYQGAIHAALKLISDSDTYISRHFVELKRSEYITGMDYYKATYNKNKSLYDHKRENGETDTELWKEMLTNRANMFANMGALQLHKKLIHIMDLRPVEHELKMEIVEINKAVPKKPLDDDL